MANNYYERGDRLNVYLADELPEYMTGKQDTQHICGKCAWYSFAKLESICRKTGKEVAYFANRECFTTDKDMDMEENNNAQPVAETGTQVCKECGRTLPLEDFQRRRNGNVDNVCKACRAEKARIGIARKKAEVLKDHGTETPVVWFEEGAAQFGAITDFSDAALLEELRRRGYKGTITKVQEVEI